MGAIYRMGMGKFCTSRKGNSHGYMASTGIWKFSSRCMEISPVSTISREIWMGGSLHLSRAGTGCYATQQGQPGCHS